MLLSTWIHSKDYWDLYQKVTFDGIARIIYVNPTVTTLDIRSEVYSAWIDWVTLRDNMKYTVPIRYTGFDPIGGGKYTGDSYFLINGWKLSVDLAKVRVTGVLFSDDYDTAYYTPTMVAQYPATVSSLVSTVAIPSAGPSAAEVWAYNNRALSVPSPTAQEIANATWAHSFTNKLLTIAKFLGLK